jgi:hypothetical protein
MAFAVSLWQKTIVKRHGKIAAPLQHPEFLPLGMLSLLLEKWPPNSRMYYDSFLLLSSLDSSILQILRNSGNSIFYRGHHSTNFLRRFYSPEYWGFLPCHRCGHRHRRSPVSVKSVWRRKPKEYRRKIMSIRVSSIYLSSISMFYYGYIQRSTFFRSYHRVSYEYLSIQRSNFSYLASIWWVQNSGPLEWDRMYPVDCNI